MEFSGFNEEDFIADESFQNWVFQRDQKSIDFWERFLLLNPNKRDIIERARGFLLKITINEAQVSDKRRISSWNRLDERIANSEGFDGSFSSNIITLLRFKNWQKVAAIFFAAVISTVLYLIFFNNQIIVNKTSFGEIKQITLPDGSKVTLNGNSVLRYYPDWKGLDSRMVWLEGEAFFSVRKKCRGKRKFLVHASDKLKIEVVGTRFNVSSRREKAFVVLNSGKIKLRIDDNPGKSKVFYLSPGDFLEYRMKEGMVKRRSVNPAVYSSWNTDNLIYDNTSISEIAEDLTNNYGLNVQILDTEISRIRVTGSIPNQNVDILLEAISKTVGLKITRDKDTVKIAKLK